MKCSHYLSTVPLLAFVLLWVITLAATHAEVGDQIHRYRIYGWPKAWLSVDFQYTPVERHNLILEKAHVSKITVHSVFHVCQAVFVCFCISGIFHTLFFWLAYRRDLRLNSSA